MHSLRRFGPALLAAACFIVISTITRVALALQANAVIPGGVSEWARIFAYGLGFWALLTCTVAWTLVRRHGQPRPQP